MLQVGGGNKLPSEMTPIMPANSVSVDGRKWADKNDEDDPSEVCGNRRPKLLTFPLIDASVA